MCLELRFRKIRYDNYLAHKLAPIQFLHCAPGTLHGLHLYIHISIGARVNMNLFNSKFLNLLFDIGIDIVLDCRIFFQSTDRKA